MKDKIKAAAKGFFVFSVRDWLLTGGIMLLATAISALARISNASDYPNSVQMIYLLGVFLIAQYTHGYFYGAFTAVISVLLTNYLFTYPYLAFNFTLPGYFTATVCTLGVAVITGVLTAQARVGTQYKIDAAREKIRGSLLRAVSHDLRSPLTTVVGASGALLENEATISPQQRKQLLTEIHTEAVWLTDVVESLLSITQLTGEENFADTCLTEMAEEVLEAAITSFRKKHPAREVRAEVPDEILVLPMRPLLIQQALVILMENAALRSPAGAAVTVSLSAKGKKVRFSVRDEGPSVSEQKLREAFDGLPVLQTGSQEEETSHSMGIGLVACRSIVRAHKGEIRARNVRGGGVEIAFTLPVKGE